MKKLIFLLSALLISLAALSQGIEFHKESYAEVLKMAKKQKKLVFIDIYTSWCGPCKHMSKNIFPQAKAGEFYNSHFLNLKLDAEKSEDGKMVAKMFEVSAYPTFLFIDGNGELVYRFLGGRDVNMFVQEGKKALEAYAAYPELKKCERKYEKGVRDKKFLDQYIVLKDKSGLDFSDLLLDYYKFVDDSELLDSVNIARIAKMTLFDSKLANRYVDAACKEAANPTKSKKATKEINKAICSFLSACLKTTAMADQEKSFDEVLVLKDRLFVAIKAKDSATSASMGGGTIYLPSNLSRLDYYASTKKVDKFNQTLVDYLVELEKKYEATYQDKIEMRKAMDEQLKAAKEKGDQKEYESVKQMRAMMFAFSGIDDYYTSTSMVENVEKYEEFYTGEKNDVYKDKVANWYVFLHKLSPSVKTAVIVADHLIGLDRKDLAVEVLTYALEEGKEGVGVEEADIKNCQLKLDELKK